MSAVSETLGWLDAVIVELKADVSSLIYAGLATGPRGENQHTQSSLFDEEWVDQRGGGYSDDYYGEIYIRKGDVWICFSYCC